MKKLLILDANSIVNRGFYAVRPLTNKDGLNTNAIFGFLNIFFKYFDEINPDYVAAAFDVSAPTFRHKMYDGYKATRHKMPDELREQIPVLKDVLSAMNIPILELAGYEADDIIGTVSRICEEEDVLCCVLTGDRDDLQLASEKTHIHLVITRMGNTETTVYDDKKVFEKYGVTPEEFIDLKAIMGDSSDNIPGVKGIGEKGATALISAFHSIDGVYENIDDASITKSVRAKLIESKDDAYMSKVLATIDRRVPIEFDIEKTQVAPYNEPALFDILSMLEFKSFIKKMGLTGEAEKKMETNFTAQFEMATEEALKDMLNRESVYFYYDKITDKFAFCYDESKAFVCDFCSNKEVIKSFLESDAINKYTHGLKELILSMKGIKVENVLADTEIGAYLLEPGRKSYDIEGLSADFLGVLLTESAESGAQLSLDGLMESEDSTSFASYAIAVLKLTEYQKKAMCEKGSSVLFETIEMPLVYVLASMEQEGITVDRDKLAEFGEMLKAELKNLTDEIYSLAGHEFNINSPKQLATVLFEELELKAIKKTKSGYSTNAEVLEKLRYVHPIVDKILEYRKIAKLNSTYVEGLIPAIDKKDGKIHSSFNQTVTVTGRISSTEPNLQNIPVRTELGREMRKMFIAKSDDFVLVDADYSQIELRVLAHIAEDENMIEAFKSDFDIHTSTAAKVFGVESSEVTGEMRSAAKAINFGLVYGMGEFSLSQDLKISVKQAKEYIEDYLGSYPNVQKYMKDTVDFAKENGYVKTMFGRRRDIPEIKASNFQTRAFGERVALNTPIQGSAADIIKLAMVNVYNRLEKENLEARLILQVHDELIIECPKYEQEKVQTVLREEMENAASLLVPLKVDMKAGRSWYDTK